MLFLFGRRVLDSKHRHRTMSTAVSIDAMNRRLSSNRYSSTMRHCLRVIAAIWMNRIVHRQSYIVIENSSVLAANRSYRIRAMMCNNIAVRNAYRNRSRLLFDKIRRWTARIAMMTMRNCIRKPLKVNIFNCVNKQYLSFRILSSTAISGSTAIVFVVVGCWSSIADNQRSSTSLFGINDSLRRWIRIDEWWQCTFRSSRPSCSLSNDGTKLESSIEWYQLEYGRARSVRRRWSDGIHIWRLRWRRTWGDIILK